MHSKLSKFLPAFVLATLLACPSLPAQSPQSSAASDPHAMVKPDPKRAKKLVEAAAKEEQAGSYEAALAAYDEAVRYAPFDVTIVAKDTELRAKLVHGYVDGAEKAAINGDLQGATQQLAAALHIDPNNDVLVERLKQMESMRDEEKGEPHQEPPEGMPILQPDKVKRSFRVQTTVQNAYEQVAAGFGLKVIFDPDLPVRNVKLQLQDADFSTAMTVLTIQTGTFWKTLNSKTIFVAADTAEKRKTFETVIEQTFSLPDSTTPADMTEVIKAVRDLTGIQRVQQSENAHSLTVRDTVPRVRLAAAIIKDLQQSPGELLLDFNFLEVDRNKAREMGILPPASVQLYYIPYNVLQQALAASSLGQALLTLESYLGLGSSTNLTSLNVTGFGGGHTTFLLTLPSVAANFSDALTLVRSGRQVLLRAQDGKPATFFAGERYPITLSLLSSSLGSGGLTPSVGGTATTTIGTQQFTVGKGPVAIATEDFRGNGEQDLAVANETDNSITILLNQGAGVALQFAQAPGSPIVLGPTASSASTGIVSPAVPLTVTSATLQSIAIAPTTASLATKGTLQYSAIGTFSDGTTQDISAGATWTSSNTTAATISSQGGLALGQAPGTTQITAALGGITSSAASLTVTSAILQSISITPTTASIGKGGDIQLTANGKFSDGSTQNVTSSTSWTSSNTNFAIVGAGLVRGVAAGSTQITTAINGITSPAATVTVTSATLKSIAVSPANLSIAAGTPLQFTATGTFSDGSAQDVTDSVAWASSQTSVATISPSSGLASAVAAGTTQITAAQGGAGSPVAIASGSINSLTDSYPDLVIASQINNSVIVLLGNGDGTFTNPKSALSYAVGNQPSSIVLDEFNSSNNANLGFVVTNFADNTYSVFVGNGDGTFTQVKGSPFHLPAGQTGPIAVTSADFNGDGIPDLAIVNQGSNNVTVLEGNGNGTFTPFTGSPLPTGNFPVAIAAGSLAGGTGPSLAIANQKDDTVTVYFGNDNGTFTVAPQSPLPVSSAPGGVAIADFGGTSYGGIGVTSSGAGTVVVYIDEGTGTLTEALEEAAGTNPLAILANEFTGNAAPDVVVTNDISGSDGFVTLLVSPSSALTQSLLGTQTPYPGSEYEDIGLKIKATPYLHSNDEVTLQLDYELRALSGSNNNGIPIISNETMTQTVRLKEGETSIISGLVNHQLAQTITGLPGLAKIPGAGYLFGLRTNNLTDDELLILVTPRKLRLPIRESRTIYAGRGEPSGRTGSLGPAPPPPSQRPEERRQENPPTAAPPPAQEPPAQPEPQPQPAPPAQQPPAPEPQPPPQQQQPEPETNPPPAPPPEQRPPE
jgi:hypothetical protein